MNQHDRWDPLTVLRSDDLPVQPDSAFADRLRRRLQAVLSLPLESLERIDMSMQTTIEDVTESTVPRPAALPYLSVTDARAALTWYADAFGATVVGDPIVMDDGRIGHAEIEIGGGTLYLADSFPEMGLTAPAPGAVSVSLMLPVADTDAAVQRVRDHAGDVVREVAESHGSRNATIIDPFGHRWMLSGPMRGAGADRAGIQHGDIGYVSLWTPDADRAAAFYGQVLGWTYDAESHQVTNTDLPTGIYEIADARTLFCCYAVTDLADARRAITAAGGTPGDTHESEFGTVLDATDSQGTAFAVYEPTAPQKRLQLNGSGPGELAYVTYQVADSAAFRDFYGAVLQWTFDAGHVEDGWEVQGAHPMSGAAGGSSRPSTVPMWTVADIDAAVARVRAAGGTVLQEPSRQPYGISAECTDDQGARFYLGEF